MCKGLSLRISQCTIKKTVKKTKQKIEQYKLAMSRHDYWKCSAPKHPLASRYVGKVFPTVMEYPQETVDILKLNALKNVCVCVWKKLNLMIIIKNNMN